MSSPMSVSRMTISGLTTGGRRATGACEAAAEATIIATKARKIRAFLMPFTLMGLRRGGSGNSIKAQRRVACFQQPRSFEQAITVLKAFFFSVLGDHQRAFAQQSGSRSAQKASVAAYSSAASHGGSRKNTS